LDAFVKETAFAQNQRKFSAREKRLAKNPLNFYRNFVLKSNCWS